VLTRLDVDTRPFADGRTFGTTGAYEELRGRAFFGLDPRHAANAGIVDLDLAPRGVDGCVESSADIRILQPRDAHTRNRRLVLDVVNRGNPVAIRNTDLGPARLPEKESQGWLLQQGYSIVSCGWQHNVPAGTERLGLQAPEAEDAHGRRMTGQLRSVLQVSAPTNVVGVADEPSGVEHVAYPVADVNDPTATLTARDYPLGPPRLVPRQDWHFTSDRTNVRYAAGFAPGTIYEITYTAQGAPLTGVGFAALRDVVSFLRFAPRSEGNPCAGSIDYALAFGGSQTGRLMRHLLYEGWCVDEDERLVVDGVLTLIAGPIRTEANMRFGQPSFIGTDSPGFAFPFTDAIQTDPQTRVTDGLLKNLRQQGKLPKVMHINTSAEYANVAVALIHLAADGQADADIPDNVRIYHMAGTHHGGGTLPLTNRIFDSVAAYYNNSVDYRPLVRAAFHNLDLWSTQAQVAPASRYPRWADGTLVEREALRQATTSLPGPGMPRERLYPTQRPDGASYPDLLPAVDTDGNEVSGIRLPDVAVPLGTYTGWNPRHASIGGTAMNLLLNGSTIPFYATAAQRRTAGDTRPSITERYASREAFLTSIRESARQLVLERYVLETDVDMLVDASGRRYDEFIKLESPLP
jgi:hypothetical protein